MDASKFSERSTASQRKSKPSSVTPFSQGTPSSSPPDSSEDWDAFMKTVTRPYAPVAAATRAIPEQKHVMDYFRVVYKRRWVAFPVFLILFVTGAVNALRQV